MEPIPNNGTLRLPLKIVGLHSDEAVLEQPEDPVSTSTSEAAATGVTSILPTATATPSSTQKPTTVSVGVDPVEGEPKRPTRPAKPETSTEPQASGKPLEGPHEEPEKPEKPEENKGSSWWAPFKETLDWVKDQFNQLVDKVNGGGSST